MSRRLRVALAGVGGLGFVFGWWRERRRRRLRILVGIDGRTRIVSNLGERLPG